MEQNLTEEELIKRAEEKIALGAELRRSLLEYIDKDIPGVEKIQRQINREMNFLAKVVYGKKLKLTHIQSSNLTHYSLLVKTLKLQRDVVQLDGGFPMEQRSRSEPLRVDIVCESGHKWIKVIARKSKSLLDAVNGAVSYGAKNILEQAQEYVDAAAQHLCMFKPPKIVFYFREEIDNMLLNKLHAIGIETICLDQAVADVHRDEEIADNVEDMRNVSVLNLDITTLLAYISAVCNGSCNWQFHEPILTEQAEKERQSALKPELDKLFAGKRLICCETAHQSFQDIIALLAGPKERQRALELMQRVEVLPDVIEVPKELATINKSAKINQRSLKIFAFGVQMKAMTVTSNKAFVRSAKMQGINVPVYTHQARALTEDKESTATPIDC